MNKIVISLIHYNSGSSTVECLESLDNIKIKDVDVEVVVLDNNSETKLELNTDKYKHPTFLHYSNSNLGFSGGHNKNIEFAKVRKAQYVLVLNNDTVVDSHFLESLYSTMQMSPNVGLAVPKIYFYPGDEFHNDRYSKHERGNVIWYAGGKIDWRNVIASHIGVDEVDDKNTFSEVLKTEFATGACVLIPMTIIEKLGGFDMKYFLYYEDCDLSMRVKRAGYDILVVPNAKVWHKNAKSTGGSGSGLQDYFISRNRLLFGLRFAPIRSRIALVKESLQLMRKGREWQRVGVRDFYKRNFGRGSYPVRD